MKKIGLKKVLLVSAFAVLAQDSVLGAANLVANPSFEGEEVAFKWVRMEAPRERVKAAEDPRFNRSKNELLQVL